MVVFTVLGLIVAGEILSQLLHPGREPHADLDDPVYVALEALNVCVNRGSS
jgi:hypothetical protein